MRIITVISVLFLLFATATADDLYKVSVSSPRDAGALEALNSDVLMSVTGGYLILITPEQTSRLRQSGLEFELLASNLRRDQLALDGRLDRKNAEIFQVLFEDGRLRLLLAGADRIALADEPVQLFHLPTIPVNIQYQPPSARVAPDLSTMPLDDIQDLMDRVEQDSLEAYVSRLQAFYRRVPGTDSSYAARDYIADKFTEFGYDSVYTDPFPAPALPYMIPCEAFNVVAYKQGTMFPDQHIIIGGHYDAVPNCPGADDNASGTAATMECARVLKDIDTRMSIVFVAFDAEESGLWGAEHYVWNALATNEDIVLMLNADMIAHYQNTNRADLFTGTETAYAQLWDQIGNAYVGIDGDLSGSSGGSDHFPFQQAGFDVVFVHEKIFSTVYHQPTDSTTYMNFDYMTRMVQATVATAYSVDQLPPPVRITVQEPGDGQSQIVNWQPIGSDAISSLELSYYATSTPLDITTIVLPPNESSLLIEGLTEYQQYAFFVKAYDNIGQTSLAYNVAYGIPNSVPDAPSGVLAMPIDHGVKVSWAYANEELDFSHCSIIRDGEVIGQTLDTFFIDDDPSLADDMHYYYVVATDDDGISSDTLGIEPRWAKAATLQPGRILAINRTSIHPVDFVNEVETGVFMREALAGYDFDYYSDTVATTCLLNCVKLTLNDLVDYGVVVIGTEAGKWEDLGISPALGGIMDTLAYYMSLGGRTVIFGRFGDLGDLTAINFVGSSHSFDDAYENWFHIDVRYQTPTYWDYTTYVAADLIAARPAYDTYPSLPWDSVATVAHATSQSASITDVNGIPCASFVQLTSSEADVIYTYDSRANDPSSENQPVAWRYFGPDYCYVFFEIPLSMFDRDAAISALRQAVDEVIAGAPQEGGEIIYPEELPVTFALSQNYPNPFNPFTRIQYSVIRTRHVEIAIYNILGQKVATIVDQTRTPGTYTVDWYGTDDAGQEVASGIYLYQMKAGRITVSKKMLLIK